MRTEKQVFEDFEKLGYHIDYNLSSLILLRKDVIFEIHKYRRSYDKYKLVCYESVVISLEEHNLLHELFEIWGWLE